jgi:hypothetical protein
MKLNMMDVIASVLQSSRLLKNFAELQSCEDVNQIDLTDLIRDGVLLRWVVSTRGLNG